MARTIPGALALTLFLALAAGGGCRDDGEAAPLSPEARRQRVQALVMKANDLLQAAIDGAADPFGQPAPVPESVALLKEAERLAGDDVAVLPKIAQLYYYQSLTAEALRLLDRTLARGALPEGSLELRVALEMKGRILLDEGRVKEAEALLNRAADGLIEANERDPGLYYGCPYQALGKLYSQTGRRAESMQAFCRAADLEPSTAAPQIEAAQAAVRGGDLVAAAAYARRALATSYTEANLRTILPLLAFVREQRQKVRTGEEPAPEAFAAFEERARQAARDGSIEPPDFLGGQPLTSVPNGRQGDDTARRRVETERTAVVVRLLVEDFLANDFEVVENVAGALVEIPPGHYEVPAKEVLRALLGYVALVRQQYDAAEETFRALSEDADADAAALARVGAGHLAIVRKEYRRARTLLAPIVAEGDDRWGAADPPDRFGDAGWLAYRMACLAMAWSFANRNRNAEAIPYYDRILRGDEGDLFALLGKGNSLSALQKLDEAEALFRKVLARDARNPFALAELGLVHYNRGEHGAAEQAFQRALAEDDETYTCPYEGLGLVYLRQGKIDEAKKHFEKAITIEPDIEYKKYNGLARIYIEEGRHAEARELLEKSIANYPYDDEARKLLDSLPPP